MILTILRVMLIGLLRDRGALAMIFLLPPAIYLIFAAIFSGTGQGNPELRMGLHVARADAALEAAIEAMPLQTLRRYDDPALLRLDLTEGRLDAGLVLSGALDDVDAAPFLLLVDPGKPMVAALLDGRLRAHLGAGMPDAMARRQMNALSRRIGPLAPTGPPDPEAAAPAALTAVEVVGDPEATDPTVTYYAGAIAVMFLLFSATQTAAGLIDDRRSGLLDRFAATPAGIDVVVMGRFAFLVLQGFVQAGAVFAVAALVDGVPVAEHPLGWVVVTALVALAAAGMGMVAAVLCTTRAQAQTVATFVVLVSSALGGSMVPRFLMPDRLREIGSFSPNAWAIDAYQGLLVRGQPLAALAEPLLALGALGVLGIAGSVLISRRRMML